MNRIYERFMDAADADMPPSRLTADEVYAAAWRRRRRRVEVWTSVTVVTVLVATIVGMQVREPAADDDAATTPTPTPSPTSTPIGDWPMGTRDGGVVFAAATDADHLYAVVTRCTADDCTTELVGSDDAGATWTVRTRDLGKADDYHVTAPAAGVLYRTTTRLDPSAAPERGTRQVREPKISRDGGRSWTDVRSTTAPVAAVPPGGWLECRNDVPTQEACPGLLAVDPETARSAPLATVPGFEVMSVVNVPASAGFWVQGYDEEKKAAAIGVSTDRGRSWTVHTFDGEPSSVLRAASVDGVTGYAILSEYRAGTVSRANPTPGPASSTHRVYRTGDAGRTWQRTDSGRVLFAGAVDVLGSYVAGHGTHLVMTVTGWHQRWYGSRDNGHSYGLGRPAGLSGELAVANAPMSGVVTHAPGVYLAFDDDAVYRSADGLTWTHRPVRY